MHTCVKLVLAVLVSVSVALPTTSDVSISEITHWGSGCPQDAENFEVAISKDAST